MALTPCKECGKQVSTEAPTCPGCGAPVAQHPKPAGSTAALGCLILIAILGVVVFSALSTPPKRNTPAPARATPETAPPEEPVRHFPDAAARKKILSGLKKERDEFQEATFYHHPQTPRDGSQIGLYIVESRDSYTLRFRARYEGDDWVFWDKLIFKIDDKVVTVEASRSDLNRDNYGGTVWEVLDVPIAAARVGGPTQDYTQPAQFAYFRLMAGKAASVRFAGDRVHDRKISSAELARFKAVGKAFTALLGLPEALPLE